MRRKLILQKPQAGVRELCRWAWRVSQGFRGRVLAVCALGILRVAASLSFVWVGKMLIDAATERSTPMRTIWLLSALLASCLLAELALSQIRNYINSLTSQRLTNSLRRRIYNHLLHSDLYADQRHSGDILNRITVDVGTVVEQSSTRCPTYW